MRFNKGRFWVSAIILGAPALVSAAFKYFDPTKPNEIPKLLSQTGFYSNITSKITDSAAKQFTVNSPLWSDGSVKKRWVILRPGRKIAWVDDTDFFDYPDSTVFVKNFLQVRAPGDTIYWETRFIVKKADSAESAQNWWGFSYRWNAAQTDANLVSLDSGANAVLSVKDNQGRASYRKWRFPSQSDCNLCHQVNSGLRTSTNGPPLLGRGVLGFFPAQLKRPTQNGASNQVLDLFAAGVFSGTQPNAASLSRRFIGMAEPIASNLTDAQRQSTIENMARSYLAANCSGCHGDRAKIIGFTQALNPPNFDYHDLQHHSTPFNEITSSGSLADTTTHTDTLSPFYGRNKYKWLVSSWGMASDPNWNLELPPGNPDTMSIHEIYINPVTRKGYPALSKALYRQWARNTPAADSVAWLLALKMDANFGDANAKAKLGWMFSKPWGSQDWQNSLIANNFPLDSVMAGWNGGDLYRNDAEGMPPLASYIPDTAALKILGEWVVKQTPPAGIRSIGLRDAGTLQIHGRFLIAPPGWTGKVQMSDIQGRVQNLEHLGKGRYALPDNARNGVYFFRAGQHTFKASILR